MYTSDHLSYFLWVLSTKKLIFRIICLVFTFIISQLSYIDHLWGLGQLLALAPRLAPNLSLTCWKSKNVLFEIKTALLEIETALAEFKTTLPEIKAALPEIEILFNKVENNYQPNEGLKVELSPSICLGRIITMTYLYIKAINLPNRDRPFWNRDRPV